MPITEKHHLELHDNRCRLVLLGDTQLNEKDCEENLLIYGSVKKIHLTSDRRAAFVDFQCEHAPLLVAQCFDYRKSNPGVPIPKGVLTLLPGCSIDDYIYLHTPHALSTPAIQRFFSEWSKQKVTVHRPEMADEPFGRAVINLDMSTESRQGREDDEPTPVKIMDNGSSHTCYAIPRLSQLMDNSGIFENEGCDKCNVAVLRYFINHEVERCIKEQIKLLEPKLAEMEKEAHITYDKRLSDHLEDNALKDHEVTRRGQDVAMKEGDQFRLLKIARSLNNVNLKDVARTMVVSSKREEPIELFSAYRFLAIYLANSSSLPEFERKLEMAEVSKQMRNLFVTILGRGKPQWARIMLVDFSNRAFPGEIPSDICQIGLRCCIDLVDFLLRLLGIGTDDNFQLPCTLKLMALMWRDEMSREGGEMRKLKTENPEAQMVLADWMRQLGCLMRESLETTERNGKTECVFLAIEFLPEMLRWATNGREEEPLRLLWPKRQLSIIINDESILFPIKGPVHGNANQQNRGGNPPYFPPPLMAAPVAAFNGFPARGMMYGPPPPSVSAQLDPHSPRSRTRLTPYEGLLPPHPSTPFPFPQCPPWPMMHPLMPPPPPSMMMLPPMGPPPMDMFPPMHLPMGLPPLFNTMGPPPRYSHTPPRAMDPAVVEHLEQRTPMESQPDEVSSTTMQQQEQQPAATTQSTPSVVCRPTSPPEDPTSEQKLSKSEENGKKAAAAAERETAPQSINGQVPGSESQSLQQSPSIEEQCEQLIRQMEQYCIMNRSIEPEPAETSELATVFEGEVQGEGSDGIDDSQENRGDANSAMATPLCIVRTGVDSDDEEETVQLKEKEGEKKENGAQLAKGDYRDTTLINRWSRSNSVDHEEEDCRSTESEYNKWLAREDGVKRDSLDGCSSDSEAEIVPLPSSLATITWGKGIEIEKATTVATVFPEEKGLHPVTPEQVTDSASNARRTVFGRVVPTFGKFKPTVPSPTNQ